MEARQVSAALAAMRNKTDKNDARGIAQILGTGWYSRVHVKSIESHYVRALLASRKAIFNKCIDLENEVRGLLKVFGVTLPPPRSASESEALQPTPTHACSTAKPAHPDCKEKRDLRENDESRRTSKWSLTLMPD